MKRLAELERLSFLAVRILRGIIEYKYNYQDHGLCFGYKLVAEFLEYSEDTERTRLT